MKPRNPTPSAALLAVAALFTLLLASGCSPSGGAGPAPGPAGASGAPDGATLPAAAGAAAASFPADTRVATFGQQAVTAGEVREALGLAQLLALRRLGSPLPPEQLRQKEFLRGVVLDLVDRRLVRAEAARRQLVIAPADLDAALRRDGGDGSAAWGRLEHDRLLGQALARELLGPFDDAGLRRAFTRLEQKIEVRAVKVPRTPTSAEVDALLRDQPAAVEAYYAAHRRDFRTPARRTVRFFQLDYLDGSDEQARHALEQQVSDLRTEVLDRKRTMLELVRQRSSHASRARDGLVGPAPREQLAAAFAVPVGSFSRVYHDQHGPYFVEVLSEEPPGERPLDGSLRREVAARAVVAGRGNRTAWTLAEQIRQGLAGQRPLAPLMREHGLVLQNSGLFPRTGEAFLPTIGLVPAALIERLFAARPPVPPEPVLEVDADLLVVQLLRRQEPDWTRFAEVKDKLPEQIVARQARQALTAWLTAQPERNAVAIDFEVLAALPAGPAATAAAAAAAPPSPPAKAAGPPR